MYSFKHSCVFFSGCRRFQSFGSLSWRFYRQVVHCICCSFGTGSDTPCVYRLFMQQRFVSLTTDFILVSYNTMKGSVVRF